MKKFELLAPAGSITALKAAVNAGADAVYIGGSMFGARAYADNPETDELIEGIKYCHLHGRKIYLTVNTLMKNDEVNGQLTAFLKPYYEAGVDAVIVQDIGAMSVISGAFPDLPIHISTQAAVTMAEGANRLKKQFRPVTRVVPARELSLEELARFRENCDLEMEVFVHGALCYSCSGQCLLSSMIGRRSGNRGRCAQPCRKMYDGKYLLSPKDQCLLGYLHELMDIGIESFKIEGRMKSPEYTCGVVSVYRKYIDKYTEMGSAAYKKWLSEHERELNRDIDFLKELYNRGGFNEGYLHTHNGPEMMTFDRPNHSGIKVGEVIATRGREAVIRFSEQVYARDVLEIRNGNDKCFEFTLGQGFDRQETFSAITMKGKNAAKGMPVYRTRCNAVIEELDVKFVNTVLKVPVKGVFTAKSGCAMRFEINANLCVGNCERCVAGSVEGPVPEPSKNAPATKENVKKQLCKMGETAFELKEPVIDIDEGLFIPSGVLNNMRREAVEKLAEEIDKCFGRTYTEKKITESIALSSTESDDMSVNRDLKQVFSVWNKDQLKAVAKAIEEYNINAEIYFNMSSFNTDVIDEIVENTEACKGAEGLYIGLPYVSRAEVYERLSAYIQKVHEQHPQIRYIARTAEEEELLESIACVYRTDYNLYGMNSQSINRLPMEFTLPQELNEDELKRVATPDSELIVFGFQPVMFSAQCVYKNKFNKCRGIEGTDFTSFTDELGHDFRARQLCAFCTNIIYNSARLDITEKMDSIAKLGVGRIRYDFTFEDAGEIMDVVGKRNIKGVEHCTNGHFTRGVI